MASFPRFRLERVHCMWSTRQLFSGPCWYFVSFMYLSRRHNTNLNFKLSVSIYIYASWLYCYSLLLLHPKDSQWNCRYNCLSLWKKKCLRSSSQTMQSFWFWVAPSTQHSNSSLLHRPSKTNFNWGTMSGGICGFLRGCSISFFVRAPWYTSPAFVTGWVILMVSVDTQWW